MFTFFVVFGIYILYTFFFYISNLVAQAPDLNLGKKSRNLLRNQENL